MNFTELANLIEITCYVIIAGTSLAVAPVVALILRGIFRKLKRLVFPIRKVSEEQFDEVIEEIHENILEIENELEHVLDEDEIKHLINSNIDKMTEGFNAALNSYEMRNRTRYENIMNEVNKLTKSKRKR